MSAPRSYRVPQPKPVLAGQLQATGYICPHRGCDYLVTFDALREERARAGRPRLQGSAASIIAKTRVRRHWSATHGPQEGGSAPSSAATARPTAPRPGG